MSSRLLAGGLFATVALATAAAPATAKIVVPDSIAGVQIGMTRAQVKQVLGTPSTTSGGGMGWAGRQLFATFGGGRLGGILTRSPRERTNKGIGVGSSRAEVKRAYPTAHYTQAMCQFTSDNGSQDLSFNFRGDKVISVSLG
jgi:hypothetical protein